MTIGNDRFGAIGQFPSFDPYQQAANRVRVFQLYCRHCGYECSDAASNPEICPKCFSAAWERFVLPGSILTNADRYQV